jgi:hypothetical protein
MPKLLEVKISTNGENHWRVSVSEDVMLSVAEWFILTEFRKYGNIINSSDKFHYLKAHYPGPKSTYLRDYSEEDWKHLDLFKNFLRLKENDFIQSKPEIPDQYCQYTLTSKGLFVLEAFNRCNLQVLYKKVEDFRAKVYELRNISK